MTQAEADWNAGSEGQTYKCQKESSQPPAGLQSESLGAGLEVWNKTNARSPTLASYLYAQGQASDIAIQASEILRTKKRLNEILSENTSQPLSKIEVDTDRDFYMTAEEAEKYGLVDKIFYSRK